jgi:hypothetical protein
MGTGKTSKTAAACHKVARAGSAMNDSRHLQRHRKDSTAQHSESGAAWLQNKLCSMHLTSIGSNSSNDEACNEPYKALLHCWQTLKLILVAPHKTKRRSKKINSHKRLTRLVSASDYVATCWCDKRWPVWTCYRYQPGSEQTC